MGGVEVENSGDGTLTVKSPWGEWQYVEEAPLYFRQVDAPYHMFFRTDDQGHVTYMFLDVAPQFAFEKINWYETPGFNMALAMGSVLIFLSMIPVAVIRFIRNRRLGGDRRPASRGARAAGWIILGVCLLNLLFLVGIALWFRPERPTELHGLPLIVEIVLGLGVLAAVLTVGALGYTVLAWKNSYWGIAGRAYYMLVTIAGVAFVWFLNYWNWLGWRF